MKLIFVLLSLAVLMAAQIPDPPQRFYVGQSIRAGSFTIRLIQFSMDKLGVTITSTDANIDRALIQVFYRSTVVLQGQPVELVLHRDLIAPVVTGAVSMADPPLDLPIYSITQIRVLGMRTVETQEVP